jgi:lysophospholipase L1-like esterase
MSYEVPRMGRQSRIRTAFARLVFTLIPLAVLLAGAELAARTLWTTMPVGDGNLPAHPTRLWTLNPHSQMPSAGVMVPIGGDGLRHVPDSSGYELRVLTLGDSNIFGYGLPHEHTPHAVLQAYLRDHQIEVDVLCGGVTGYSSLQSLALLEEQGWDLQPDLLVVGNLLSDEYQDYRSDRDRIEGRETPWARLEWSLLRWSLAWKWFRLRVIESAAGERVIRSAAQYVVSDTARVPLEEYEQNLLAMCRGAAEHDVGLVFYQPPTREQLEDPRLRSRHAEAMERAAQACHVPILRGIDVLREDGTLSPDQAFMDDVHASGQANRLLYRALGALLRSKGWPHARLVPRLDGAPQP